ncbi:MAG: hypothetical protein H6626_13055 [Pseudobdellovibrionaceae bacterium]|nr:hypothetical protein [Bdellovibrionales bacterium]USN47103.1 MAG: hypothetical protein H6626_13055 [Pseudobdellovibrionaceae bacterium]
MAMKKLARYTFLVFLAATSLASNSEENEYDVILRDMNRIKVIDAYGGKVVKIEGEIKKGDYQRFLAVVKKAGSSVREIYLYSPGGDAQEAMKIGRLMRKLRYSVNAPAFDVEGKRVCTPPPDNPENCRCDSSCFLIYVGGAHRNAKLLGIHRIYIDHKFQKGLSGTDSSKFSKAIKADVSSYLKEMSVPTTYTDKLFSVPSTKIEYISQADLARYFIGDIPEFQEWIIAQCEKEIKYNDEMMHIWKRVKAGVSSKEEQKKLQQEKQFYLKLTDCEMHARTKLTNEVWVRELRKAIKEEFPNTKFKF